MKWHPRENTNAIIRSCTARHACKHNKFKLLHVRVSRLQLSYISYEDNWWKFHASAYPKNKWLIYSKSVPWMYICFLTHNKNIKYKHKASITDQSKRKQHAFEPMCFNRRCNFEKLRAFPSLKLLELNLKLRFRGRSWWVYERFLRCCSVKSHGDRS